MNNYEVDATLSFMFPQPRSHRFFFFDIAWRLIVDNYHGQTISKQQVCADRHKCGTGDAVVSKHVAEPFALWDNDASCCGRNCNALSVNRDFGATVLQGAHAR